MIRRRDYTERVLYTIQKRNYMARDYHIRKKELYRRRSGTTLYNGKTTRERD